MVTTLVLKPFLVLILTLYLGLVIQYARIFCDCASFYRRALALSLETEFGASPC